MGLEFLNHIIFVGITHRQKVIVVLLTVHVHRLDDVHQRVECVGHALVPSDTDDKRSARGEIITLTRMCCNRRGVPVGFRIQHLPRHLRRAAPGDPPQHACDEVARVRRVHGLEIELLPVPATTPHVQKETWGQGSSVRT